MIKLKTIIEQSFCDNTPQGSCAQEWFGPRAQAMSNFMFNKNCDGKHNFETVNARMDQKINSIMSPWTSFAFEELGYIPENEINVILNARNWNQISNGVNDFKALTGYDGQYSPYSGNIPGMLKRVLAKKGWAECMMAGCGC